MNDWITKKPISKFLVEDCYRLHTRDLGKGILSPTNAKSKDKISTNKTALLLNGLSVMRVSFKINLEANPINIKIFFSRDPKNWSKDLGISQTVDIEPCELRFGTRFYFKCGCGKKANILCLRPDIPYYFACRECLNLKYYLTTINRNSFGREIFYWFNRVEKAREKMAEIKRLTYNGKVTKRTAYALSVAKKYNLLSNETAKKKISYQLQKLGVSELQKI